ncbi:MAG: ribosome maturation factor RimP, partial [Candidatus Zixiibacteriota bacterium]
ESRLQVFVDSDRGVSIDDCARLSKAIGPVLDAQTIFRGGYTLEVSSPGMDRPLETAKDFRRRVGNKIEIHFNDNTVRPLRGVLIGAEGQTIDLQVENDVKKLDLVDIKMGKILF